MTRDAILAAALALLDEGTDLSMRGVAARLGVTPMSLYHHVTDRTGLLVALSDRVYADVLDNLGAAAPAAQLRTLLTRYHAAVGRHPQLTLAIFAEPAAFAGVTVHITDRLTALLTELTAQPLAWRDVLVDHAHGSALALLAASGTRADALRAAYVQALELLLAALPASSPAPERERKRRPPEPGGRH